MLNELTLCDLEQDIFDKIQKIKTDNKRDICKQVEKIKKNLELRNENYIEGMLQGAELMLKAVREELKKESEQE